MFERIVGVEVKAGETYEVPRLTEYFLIADYGCVLAHRRAWQAVADGPNEWVLILEVNVHAMSMLFN